MTPGDTAGSRPASEYGVAKWSVGQRATGLSDGALERALADGTILRTHVLRPTWHFALPDDIRWLTELTGPRVHAQNAYWYRKFGLDDEALGRTTQLLAAHGSSAAGLRRVRHRLQRDQAPARRRGHRRRRGRRRAMFTHAVIVDGQVAGHWRRTVKTKAVTIEVQLVRHLDAPEMDALQAAVERHAAFVGVPGELVVTSAPG